MKDKEARQDIAIQKMNQEFADNRIRELRAEFGWTNDKLNMLLEYLGLEVVRQDIDRHDRSQFIRKKGQQ